MIEVAAQIWRTLESGGAVMAALACLSIMLYGTLYRTGDFVRCFNAGPSGLSAPLRDALRDTADSRELRIRYREHVATQLRYAKALIVASPLLGLLGTVVGMLDTFAVLSLRNSLDTARSVADGISIALITTQAGLMIAVPALFMREWIKRRSEVNERMLFSCRRSSLKKRQISD